MVREDYIVKYAKKIIHKTVRKQSLLKSANSSPRFESFSLSLSLSLPFLVRYTT